VLDYGSGNIRSAERALERAGASVTVSSDFETAVNADGLFVSGVGAYEACMEGLRAVNGPRLIGRRLAGGRPVMGVCVGMQVLFERGVEHGVVSEGCGEWPGTVERLDAPIVPHMGWNTLDIAEGTKLFAGLDADTRFYFVHSYAVRSGSSTRPRASPRRWCTGRHTASRSSRPSRTARCAPRSSIRRSPATPEPRCSPTGSSSSADPAVRRTPA